MEKKIQKTEIWPLAIIGSFLFFGAFIFFMVFLMSREKVDLVSPTYYKEEIAFQSQIDKQNYTRTQGKSFSWKIVNDELQIQVPGANTFTQGKLNFLYLADAEKDLQINFKANEVGLLILPIQQFKKGNWVLKLDWVHGGESFFDEQKLMIP